MAKQSGTSKPTPPKSPKPAKGSGQPSTTNPSAGAEKALRSNPAKDTRPPASAKKSHKP
ncbi:MAG: hypothetical protein V9G63_06350 [Candidatus Competibacter sp.]|nr:hypothetical protein [Candidatus Competibacteraceae bacterium]